MFVALVATRAMAQSRIEGAVHGVDGTPLPGATVQLESSEYKKPLTTTTDAEGKYAFENVKAGIRVRLVATHGGRVVAQSFPLISLWVEQIDLDERPIPERPATAYDVLAMTGPSGEVAGLVRAADGEAVEGARITINETALTATTDSAGRFVFSGLRPGVRVELNVAAAGHEPASSERVIVAGSRVNVDFALAPAAAPGTDESAGPELSVLQAVGDRDGLRAEPARVATVPSLDDRDVFRAIQFLPGVVGSLENASDLYVRGGTPGQARVTYDGFTLYQLPTAYGRFSPFNPDLIARADLTRSAFGAADGGRLAGALNLTGTSDASGRLGGFLNVSMLGLGAGVSVPLAEKGSLVFAGRTSPPQSIYEDALDLYSPQVGVAARDAAPRYSGGPLGPAATSAFHDFNIRFDLRASEKDHVSASFYDGNDELNNSHTLPSPSPIESVIPVEGFELPADAFVQVTDLSDWSARGWSGSWRRQWSPGVSTKVSVGRSEYAATGQGAWLLTDESTGADYSYPSGRGGSSALSESNTVEDTTVRVDSSMALGFEHALSVGGDVTLLDVGYSLQSEIVDRSSTGVALRSRLAPLYVTAGSGRLVTVYAQDAWRPFARLVVTPGVRLTNYDLSGETFFEPRVGVSYQLTRSMRLTGGWSLDHQAIDRITREDRLHGDGQFWALSDGTAIPVARSRQYAAGASVEVAGLLFQLDGYYRDLEDVSYFAPRLFPGTAPAPGATLMHVGTGTAGGFDLLLQKKSANNTLWTSYSLGRVEYTCPTLEAVTFPASHNQKHELKVVDTLRFLRRWSVSGAWVLGSGRPYTEAQQSGQVWFPSGASIYDVSFGEKNGSALPAYHRLDVSAQREFALGRVLTSLGVTVFNVYDRDNVWYVDYEYATDSVRANDVLFMGRAVNAYFRMAF
jgi:hypothetical protein